MLRSISIAMLCLPWTVEANAADLPVLEIIGVCDQAAEQAGLLKALKFNECVDGQQNHYDDLKLNWGKVTEASQDLCLERMNELTDALPPLYSTLKMCIENELAEAAPRRQFRY